MINRKQEAEEGHPVAQRDDEDKPWPRYGEAAKRGQDRRRDWPVKTLTGNQAAAYAARLSRMQVGLFFPIGPSDEIMETVEHFIRRGEMPGVEIIQLQTEGGTISAQVNLAQQGIRTMFTTSAEGLWWGGVQIHSGASARLPFMVTVTTRAPGPPRTVANDHQDVFSQRDSGCLIFMCEDGQDVLDTIIQAYRVMEDPEVSLPAIVAYDGWEVSHSTYRCTIPPQEVVDRFLPPRKLAENQDMLARDWCEWHQQRRTNLGTSDWYMENKYKMQLAHQRAKRVIERASDEYKALTGGTNGGLVEGYRLEDAEVVLLTMGAACATARFVAQIYRERGYRVGMAKLKTIRPFPEDVLAEMIGPAKVVITMERVPHNPIYTEVRAALADCRPQPIVMGRVVGIGGRDVSYEDVSRIVEDGLRAATTGQAERKLEWVPIIGIQHGVLSSASPAVSTSKE